MAWNGSKTSKDETCPKRHVFVKQMNLTPYRILRWHTAIRGQILLTNVEAFPQPLEHQVVPRYGNSGGQLVTPGLRMECLDAEDRQQCLGTPVGAGGQGQAFKALEN